MSISLQKDPVSSFFICSVFSFKQKSGTSVAILTNKAVELGAADKIVALLYLIPVGHFVDYEEGPSLLPTLDSFGPVTLRRDNVRAVIRVVVDLDLEVQRP